MLKFPNEKLESRFNGEYRYGASDYYRTLALAILGFLIIISLTGLVIEFSVNREGVQAFLWYGLIPLTALALLALYISKLESYTWYVVIMYAVAMTILCATYPRLNGDIMLAESYGFSYISFTLFVVLAFARLPIIYAIGLIAVAFSLYSAVQAAWLGSPILGHHLPLISGATALGFAVGYLIERNSRALFAARTEVEDREQLLAESQKKLQEEKEKTEALILNMLPESIAHRLKEEGRSIADGIVECTVLFSDVVGFTSLAESTGPKALVRLLNDLFSMFDDLCERHDMEKIKTIGDAYMAAAGVPDYIEAHPAAAANMAIDMLSAVEEFNEKHDVELNLRIGLHSGPVVAGIIGTRKFTYDLWGDTVNIAARMESHGHPGKIQVSETTARFLKRTHELEERGEIDVKGKGAIRTFWLHGKLNE